METSASAKLPFCKRFSPSTLGASSSSAESPGGLPSPDTVNVTEATVASVVPVFIDIIEKYLHPFVSGIIVGLP